MVSRVLKFIAAMGITLSILAELGWIQILHPRLQDIYQLLSKGVSILLYLFFP